MFAARVLKPLFHGRRHISSLGRNCEIAVISKRVLQDRFSQIMNILRLSGNGVGINRAFHSSPQCYTDVGTLVNQNFDDLRKDDEVVNLTMVGSYSVNLTMVGSYSVNFSGVKTHAPALFSHLEDDFYSELGSVEKDVNRNVIVQMLLTEKKPEAFQVEKSQKTKGKKKKKKKKKKHEQDSDSISKPVLLTEKPQVSWNTNNGKRKTELAHTSSPARDVTDSNVAFSKPTMSSSQVQDHKSKSQNIITPSSEAKNETSSKGTPSNHPSSVVVIRIGKLNLKTADSVIHSMCSSIGPFEGLARVNEGTVDVMFRVTKLNEADSILEELNDATVDNSQWTAEIVPESEEASKDQMGMRITSCCEDVEKQLVMQRVLGKDLEILLHSVMHLENHPMAREMD